MKNIKLAIYIFIELLLILMARLIFINTGIIESLTSETSIGETIRPIVQNLYFLQGLVLFIPFLVVLGLIIRELAIINKEKQESKRKALEVSDVAEIEIEEDTEETQRIQAELLKKAMDEKQQKLFHCLEERLKNQKTQSTKATSETILGCIAAVYEITQAEIFLHQKKDDHEKLVLSATYAFYVPEEKVYEFEMGEGLIGQVAKAGEPLYMSELPQGYITVKSGLGESTPSHLAIIPWKNKENKSFAILEVASFKPLVKEDIRLLEQLSEKISDFYA
jgi:hypothetical protein